MYVPHVSAYRLNVFIAFVYFAKYPVLFLVGRVHRKSVLYILTVCVGKVERLYPEKHVHVRKILRNTVARFLPAPQCRAEVTVEANGYAKLISGFQRKHYQRAAVFGKSGGYAAKVKPGKTFKLLFKVHFGKVVSRKTAVFSVVSYLGRSYAEALLQKVNAHSAVVGIYAGRAMHVV